MNKSEKNGALSTLKNKLSTWIKSGRIHTASLTMPIFILGHLTAGGELFSWMTLHWAMLGLLWHWVGFLDNNKYDTEYDKLDPNKQHFPLVQGLLKLEHVKIVTTVGWIIIALYGLWLSQSVWWFILLGSIGAAYLYNKYSKRTLTATIWICLAFSPLYVFAHLTSGGEPNGLMWGIFVYGLFQLGFQIAYSGYLKDMEAPGQKNLLMRLGSKVKDGIFWPSKGTYLLSYGLRAGTIIAFLIIQQGYWELIIGVMLLLAGQNFASRMTHKHEWNRKLDLKRMTAVEVFTYFGLLVALISNIGIDSVLFLIIFPFVWFVIWNKIIWNTLFAPKV